MTEFLRVQDVLDRLKFKKSMWYAGVKAGIFPKPIKLSTRCSVWRKEDIDDLINILGAEVMADRSWIERLENER